MKVITRAHDEFNVTVTECDHVTFGKVRETYDTGSKLFAKNLIDMTIKIFNIDEVIAVVP